MKIRILFFCGILTILSLTACGYVNGNNSENNQSKFSLKEKIAYHPKVMVSVEKKIVTDFIYDVGPRFNAIKKSNLDAVSSFSDFIEEEHAQRIVYYTSVSVIVLNGDKKTDRKETGNKGVFNSAQLKLLQSSDYSTNLLIWADYQEKSFHTGQLEYSTWTPYLSVVPEKQATYSDNMDSLKKFLQDKTEEVRAHVDPDKLQPAKLFFTVTKNGTITNVYLDRPSGYPLVDEKMIELITKAPGTWSPAENLKGEKVAQELVVSFGSMGC
jgi:hypothetical protein